MCVFVCVYSSFQSLRHMIEIFLSVDEMGSLEQLEGTDNTLAPENQKSVCLCLCVCVCKCRKVYDSGKYVCVS